jgi:hypothetical protein
MDQVLVHRGGGSVGNDENESQTCQMLLFYHFSLLLRCFHCLRMACMGGHSDPYGRSPMLPS